MKAIALLLACCLCVACGDKPDSGPTTPDTGGAAVATKTIELNVEGMTCSGCSASVIQLLKAVPGVVEADVNHETGVAVCKTTDAVDGAALTKAVTGKFKATVKS